MRTPIRKGMESTFDIEATRIPESKQKQRIDMLQHNLHNIIQTENWTNEFHKLKWHINLLRSHVNDWRINQQGNRWNKYIIEVSSHMFVLNAPWHVLQRALQSPDQHSQGSFKMQPPSVTTLMITSPLDVEPQPHIMHPLEDYLRATWIPTY